MRSCRWLVVAGALLAALVVPVAASAHGTYNAFAGNLMPLGKFNEITGAGFVATKNRHPLSFNERIGFIPNGFEGVHVFDVSNPADPDLLSSVDLACGSHTASGVPDVDNGRFIVYSTPSSGACDGRRRGRAAWASPCGASAARTAGRCWTRSSSTTRPSATA